MAYHEIGHALVAARQSDSAPVQKITIIPRTSGALGYTMQVDEGNHYLMSKEEIENKIATLTGGRAAEELVFGTVTTGAANDIEQATKLARAMISRYGMSDSFDMVAMEKVQNQYLGGDTTLSCSDDTQARIDEAVVALSGVPREPDLTYYRKTQGKLKDYKSVNATGALQIRSVMDSLSVWANRILKATSQKTLPTEEELSDERTAKVIDRRLRELGREPVWKDWDAAFDFINRAV